LEVEDPLYKQLYRPSEQLNKSFVRSPDNTMMGMVFYANIGKMKESLQNASTEKFPTTQGKRQ